MALTKQISVDKIEIVGTHKLVQVRQATVILDDGVEVGRTNHRYVLNPNSDITSEPSDVQAVCNAIHTQEVKDAYTAAIAQEEAD